MSLVTKIRQSNITARLALMLGSLGIVAMIGFGAVSAQIGSSSGTGYGSGTATDVAAADTFESDVLAYNNTFTQQIQGLETTALNQLKSTSSTADFEAFNTEYNTATATYFNTTSNAFDTFRTEVQSYANSATSKDRFIDEFNNAKANYLNSLQAAKNQLADSLGQMGSEANVIKDQFIDGFNTDSAALSNNLEQAKNDFAAVLG
jgi:hypothetical protein